MFESSVILEGSKTMAAADIMGVRFESSVILEGSKTGFFMPDFSHLFESSVILEGSKTVRMRSAKSVCLRVVLF